MVNELLAGHKVSSEWFTPEDIWQRIENTFGTKVIYDPCPRGCADDGLDVDWVDNYNYVLDLPFIYVNPPSPSAPWAKKTIQTVTENPQVSIIFAAFSEAVLWQVPELHDHLICWVRNRINWIDGNQWVKYKNVPDILDVLAPEGYTSNPNYLKPAKSPRNYNAFICLAQSPEIRYRFIQNFQDLGTVRVSQRITLD